MYSLMLVPMLATATFVGLSDDKATLLEQIREAYSGLETLSFELQIKEDLPEMRSADEYRRARKRTLEVRVLMAKGGRFRAEAFEGRERIATMVSDGHEVFEWAKEGDCWTRYAAASSTEQGGKVLLRYKDYPFVGCVDFIEPQGSIAEWCEGLARPEAKIVGTATIDGRECDVIEQKTVDTWQDERFTSRATVCFDRKHHFLVKLSETAEGTKGGRRVNSLSRSHLFRHIRPNVELPEDAFTFTPPAGSKFIPPEKIEHRREKPPSLDGQPAPDFTLSSVKGDKVSLADFKDKKPVLLVFWATWCRPCRQEMPTLIKLHREFGDKGLAVVSVSTDGKMETLKSFLESNPLPYPILHDATGEVSRSYFAGGIPYTVLIDESGKVVKTWRGWGGEEEEREIRAELAGLGIGSPSAATRPAAEAGE